MHVEPVEHASPDPVEHAPSGAVERASEDPIEHALGEALTLASQAKQWDVVATLAAELQARRQARAGVVDLAAERKRRGLE